MSKISVFLTCDWSVVINRDNRKSWRFWSYLLLETKKLIFDHSHLCLNWPIDKECSELFLALANFLSQPSLRTLMKRKVQSLQAQVNIIQLRRLCRLKQCQCLLLLFAHDHSSRIFLYLENSCFTKFYILKVKFIF